MSDVIEFNSSLDPQTRVVYEALRPGPVVITVGFIGYLVEGFPGAAVAALATFIPCYIFTILPAPYFKKHGRNPAIKAFVDGVTAGYLLAVQVFSLEHRGLTAEVDELFVGSGHRAAGLGRRLLQAAESEFAARGCTNVSLQLGRGNDAGRAFYLSQGYAPRAGFELLEKPLRPPRC